MPVGTFRAPLFIQKFDKKKCYRRRLAILIEGDREMPNLMPNFPRSQQKQFEIWD